MGATRVYDPFCKSLTADLLSQADRDLLVCATDHPHHAGAMHGLVLAIPLAALLWTAIAAAFHAAIQLLLR